MSVVNISLGLLTVAVQLEPSYPDALHEASQRAKELFHEGLVEAEARGIDLTALQFEDVTEDEED